MKRRNFEIHKLICKECEQAMYVPRIVGRFRPKGHIKHMYCVNCRKVTEHREISNDLFR